MTQARTRIAVAGATGRVGRHVVDVLEARGYEVVPIARSRGVDVITGAGLAEALAGVEAVVDAATGASADQSAATEFFTTASRNLQEEGARAGVRRIVVVSIVGADRFSVGYNVAKVAHERAARSGPIPAFVLRATQFHEFVEQLVRWGTRGDVAYVQRMRTRLVAARTVAEALADLATNPPPEPQAGTPEIGGPREESLVAMAELFVAQRGVPVRVVGVSDPGEPNADLFESGALLPGPGATLAGPTFEEWLAEG